MAGCKIIIKFILTRKAQTIIQWATNIKIRMAKGKPNKWAVFFTSACLKCFSEIIVLVCPGRVIVAGEMNQRVVRPGGVQEHGAVALKERITAAAAAAVAVVVYYHDCRRDARFLAWEQSTEFRFCVSGRTLFLYSETCFYENIPDLNSLKQHSCWLYCWYKAGKNTFLMHFGLFGFS